MFTAGIVAEFNPFHKGHAYLIAEARKRGASHIAVAMSGAAVQRGEPAICSKHERAAAAVENGADLVIELPAPFSCSAAPWFADSAVQILGQLNINALAFGSEFESAELLKNAANAMQNLSESEAVKRALAGGLSYPAALKAAVLKIYGEEIAAAVSSPNSTLACEYITALSKYAPNAEIIPVKRVGAGHDLPPQDGFASGSYLRGAIQNGGNALEYLPNGVNITPPKQPQAAENAIYYRLLTATREQFLRLPEVNENLADRILRAAEQPAEDLQTFLAQVKPRNFTLARIRRSALHLAIGAEKADFTDGVPYLRILAFNKRGAEIIARAKGDLPISTSLRKLEKSSTRAAHIAAIENRAVRLMQMNTGIFENEYTRKIVPAD